MSTLRSLFPVALATTALLLTVVTGGCDNHSASPAAQTTTTHDQSATPAATPQAPRAASGAPDAKQGTFTITGTVPTLEDGTTKDGDEVKLLLVDGAIGSEGKPAATARVEHGSFRLTGSVDQPLMANLQIGVKVLVPMIVENTAYQVVDLGAGPVVKGGHYNDEAYGYLWMPTYIEAAKIRLGKLQKALAGVDRSDVAAVEAAQASVRESWQPEQKIKDDYQSRILDGNGPALLKLFVLSDNQDGKRYDRAKRTEMLADYERVLGDNPLIASMHQADELQKKSQEMQKETAVGKAYKDVVAMDANGTSVKLSTVLAKNKLVLLDFWASWCGPCRGEFPYMRKVYKKFHGQGFEIYAVSLDEDKDAWRKALREENDKGGIPWINLGDAAGFDSKSAKSYGILGLPGNYLIASDGTIVGINMRESNLEQVVRAQLRRLDGTHGL